MNKTERIIIVGAGEIGQAIGKILQNKQGTIIEFWDKKPTIVPGQKSLAKIISSIKAPVANTRFLFLCVPSWAMRTVAGSIGQWFDKRTIVVSLAKGIEEKTLKTMDRLLEELLPKDRLFALLTGPMLAEELSNGQTGVGLVSSSQKQTYSALIKLFENTNLRLEYSADVYGSALASVLKNIYATGLGIAEALNLGGNTKGWLVQKAVTEMTEIIKGLGGRRETALGPAGLGDLVATGFSPYSSNRQVGDILVNPVRKPALSHQPDRHHFHGPEKQLSNGVKVSKTTLKSEGLVSLPCLLKLLSKAGVEEKINNFYFLKALQKIIIQRENPKIIFNELINAKTKNAL